MSANTDHMTIACDGCGAEAGEQCTYPCLSWVTREEIDRLPLDVKVISDHHNTAGTWCLWSLTTVSLTTPTPRAPRPARRAPWWTRTPPAAPAVSTSSRPGTTSPGPDQ